MTWYHGDAPVEETARTTIEDSQGWCYMKRKHVQASDAGVYRVTAENVAGLDEATFNVNVLGACVLDQHQLTQHPTYIKISAQNFSSFLKQLH